MNRAVSPAEFGLNITEQVTRLANAAQTLQVQNEELAQKLRAAEEKIKELSPKPEE